MYKSVKSSWHIHSSDNVSLSIQDKAQWLSKNCKKRYTCNNGKNKSKNFKCPKNSRCVKGRCKCKKNYKTDKKYKSGILNRCKKSKGKTLTSSFVLLLHRKVFTIVLTVRKSLHNEFGLQIDI